MRRSTTLPLLLILSVPSSSFDLPFFGAKKPPPPDLTDSQIQDKYGVQLPAYDVLRESGEKDTVKWEVRKYQDISAVQCEYVKRPDGYGMIGAYFNGEEMRGVRRRTVL